MKTLENWLMNKLNNLESMSDFDVATDTVRCWIDEYNDLKEQPSLSKWDKLNKEFNEALEKAKNDGWFEDRKEKLISLPIENKEMLDELDFVHPICRDLFFDRGFKTGYSVGYAKANQLLDLLEEWVKAEFIKNNSILIYPLLDKIQELKIK